MNTVPGQAASAPRLALPNAIHRCRAIVALRGEDNAAILRAAEVIAEEGLVAIEIPVTSPESYGQISDLAGLRKRARQVVRTVADRYDRVLDVPHYSPTNGKAQ